MKQVIFYHIPTQNEDCRIDFYVTPNIIFYSSNYYTKGNPLICYNNENWIEIIKDRGYWDYFYRKIMEYDYKQGEIFSERARKCFEQFVKAVKEIK